MPFADHVFTKSDAGITVVQDDNDLIDGTGAVRMDNFGNEFSPAVNIAQERLGPAFAIGETSGFIRTKFQVSEQLFLITREGQYGIYFMASQLDLTLGAGTAYAFVLHADNTGFSWRLVQYSLGISISGVTTLESGETTGDPVLGKNMVMEADWDLDIDGIGGMRIICRAAAGTDYSQLEEVYNVTIGSPLTTTTCEGLLYADLEGSATNDLKRIYYQDTFYSNFSQDVLG